MDWIHCSSCFSQPLSGNNDAAEHLFYLTSCGYIFCENCGCFADGTLDCCKHCRNKCSTTLIGGKSFQKNQEVLEYFQEPEEICSALLKVMQFQKSHRIKLVRHHQYMLSKYNSAKVYIKKLENELKIIKNGLHNTPQKPRYCRTETQLISSTIFEPNSASFKMINAESKSTPNIRQNRAYLRHRKQSNELSMSSLGSTASGMFTPRSSEYANPLEENRNEKSMPAIDNLHLYNSFLHRVLKKK